MSLSLLQKIAASLTETIRLYRILIAQKNAAPSPGYSHLISVIRRIAKQYNINPDLAVKVARCESGLKHTAVNVNASGSIDRGLFQWNDKHHPEISNKVAFDIEKSTQAFCQAVKAGHLVWWSASYKCWRDYEV